MPSSWTETEDGRSSAVSRDSKDTLPENSGFGAASAEEKAAFAALRNSLDEALAGTRLAKDRAAKCLTQIMIPEALDYPM